MCHECGSTLTCFSNDDEKCLERELSKMKTFYTGGALLGRGRGGPLRHNEICRGVECAGVLWFHHDAKTPVGKESLEQHLNGTVMSLMKRFGTTPPPPFPWPEDESPANEQEKCSGNEVQPGKPTECRRLQAHSADSLGLQVPRVIKDEVDEKGKTDEEDGEDVDGSKDVKGSAVEGQMNLKVVKLPQLRLGLKVGAVYTAAELEAMCRRRPKKLQELRKKMDDPVFFQPVHSQMH